MVIREAINAYTTAKANCIGRDFLDTIQNTNLCFMIPLNNGTEMFIDTCTGDYFKEHYPLEQPNKNGVFKRISFEISEKEPDLTSISKYVSKSQANGVMYYVDCAKERCVNEFISLNGGINEEMFYARLKDLFDMPNVSNEEDKESVA